MYKKQMKMQRIACYLSIAASALVFLYALGIMTDLYDMLYTMVPVPDDPTSVKVAGAMIYYDMQGFNKTLLGASIGLILSSVLLFITNTHARRKYYIGNYVAIAISAVANIGVADRFVEQGTTSRQREQIGLDVTGITNQILQALTRKDVEG